MIEMEEKKFSFNIENLIIGVAIGFFLGYAIAKKTIEPGTQSLSQLSQLNIGIRQLSNRLAIIEARLGIPHSLEVPLSHDESLSDSKSLNSPPSNMKQIMENEEIFDIKKDEKGRMIGFTNHRKLFSTGSD